MFGVINEAIYFVPVLLYELCYLGVVCLCCAGVRTS